MPVIAAPPLRLLRPIPTPTLEIFSTPTDYFDLLPSELILHIFSYLDADDLLVCGEVCPRWCHLASNWHLWQCKLFATPLFTIVCPEAPSQPFPLQDLSASTHPREIYRFLQQYVPKCSVGGVGAPVDEVQCGSPNSTQLQSPAPGEVSQQQPTQARFLSVMNSIGQHVRSLLPMWYLQRLSNSSTTSPDAKRPIFAFFGPGLDHRWTSRLFWKMVDTRTRSFEPTSVFTGHMGFGSGITLRLFSQAQHAVMDGSTRCSSFANRKVCDDYAASPKLRPANSSSFGNRLTSCLSASNSPPHRPPVRSGSPPLVHHSTDYHCQCHQHEDFTFDMSYLYSLPPHLKHVFNDQFTRLRVSRLLSHPSRRGEEDAELARVPSLPPAELESFFSQLRVSTEMELFCRKLDGLVYAIDARESADQLAHLCYELRAVLRGFPETVANRIPVVILYIMPKEDIRLSPASRVRRPLVFNLVNRDSYSGADYTAAWHDSILLPISVLKLFELPNPWRLQKCSSNDIKTLIQSLMWLNLNYIRPTAGSNSANTDN